MSYKKSLALSASVIVGNLIMVAPAANAQVQESFGIEEIVVTARKREESLQDVPLAVTALDASILERSHVSTITDIDKLVPNVDFADNPFAGQALGATIRGVGFSDLEKSFEPAVGFSIDGVFLASNTGGAIDAFDIEQVEVLRGPQGTLFGRNTVGGVVNVTRSRPTGELGLKLGTRITNHNGKEFLAVANSPQLGGVLSAKAYGFKKEHDTYAKNIVTGEKDKQTDVVSGGISLLFEPNDKLEALISIDAFDDNGQGPPTYSLTVPGETFCNIPTGLVAGMLVQTTAEGATPGCAGSSLAVAEASNYEEFARGTPFITEIDGWSATSNINYELDNGFTVTSVTGYRETSDRLLEENIGGPSLITTAAGAGAFQAAELRLLYQNREQEASQFSQEFRLSGDISDDLTFVAGVYYLDSEYTLTGGTYPNGQFGNTQVLNGVTAETEVAHQTKAMAIFVDGTYDITDQLSFSGGLRYSAEEKDFQIDYIVGAGVAGTSADVSEKWSSPTARAILQYEVSDDAMIYGGWSRGFRSGGFNGRAASVSSVGPYDPETLDSFEAGLRTDHLNDRLRVNPTVFIAKYNDKQEESLEAIGDPDLGNTETTVQNASKVDIWGLELEVLGRVTPELTLRGAFGYVDAEFKEFLGINDADPSGPFIDLKDSRNLRSGPDMTLSIGGTYIRNIMDDKLEMTLDAGYSYQDDMITSRSQDALGLGRDVVDSINSTDFSASFRTLREGPNLTLTAYINDAFDKDAGRIASSIHVPGTLTFGTGAPTTLYGVEATVEF